MDIVFSVSLCFALAALLLSRLYEKYWIKERGTAVLVNVGGSDYLNDGNNHCNCETIDLTGKYYQVEFGGPEKIFDGITVRAVIEGLRPYEIRAKVFLNDGNFVINGNISIIHRTRFDKEHSAIYYDENSKINHTDTQTDVQLFDYDLIFIKGGDDSTIASFVFLRVADIKDDKIHSLGKIIVENQRLNITGDEQNVE